MKPSKVVAKNNVVAVRVHKKDKRRSGEPYHLVKVTGPLRQLKEGGKFQGTWFDRGFFVFDAQWYHYRGTSEVGGMAVGNRHYTLGTAPGDRITMQLNGVVTGVDEFDSFKQIVKKTGRDKMYVMLAADHDSIMEKGNLAS